MTCNTIATRLARRSLRAVVFGVLVLYDLVVIAAAPNTHIRLDKGGTAWIDHTNVKVVEVILDHLAYGHSPEEIHLQHPHLSLAQVHAAFTYYFDHQTRLDAELERRYRRAETLRPGAANQPSRKKLLARLKKR